MARPALVPGVSGTGAVPGGRHTLRAATSGRTPHLSLVPDNSSDEATDTAGWAS